MKRLIKSTLLTAIFVSTLFVGTVIVIDNYENWDDSEEIAEDLLDDLQNIKNKVSKKIIKKYKEVI